MVNPGAVKVLVLHWICSVQQWSGVPKTALVNYMYITAVHYSGLLISESTVIIVRVKVVFYCC